MELEANSGWQVRRECRPEAPQLPSGDLDLDLGDVEATIASLRSELSQKPPAEVLREREGPSGAKTKGLCAVPARSWAGIIEATLVVQEKVFREALRARARKQARWHTDVERHRRLCSDTLPSVAVFACEMKASIGWHQHVASCAGE